MEFKDMTKDSLLKLIVQYKLDDKLKEFGSDPKKVKNDDIVKILEAYKAEKNATAEVEVEPKVKTKKVAGKGRKMTQADIIEYLNTAKPYIVIDRDTSYTIADDDENRTTEIEWGNPIIGMTKEKIVLNGMRQFITNGGMKAMKNLYMPDVKIDKATGRVVPMKPKRRFDITPVEGFTESEWKALEEKSRMDSTLAGQ